MLKEDQTASEIHQAELPGSVADHSKTSPLDSESAESVLQGAPAESAFYAKRFLFVVACLLTGWLVVVVRLVGIYISEVDSMQNRVAEQQTTTQPVAARPGDILDRNGRLLATSVETSSLFAVPRAIEDPDQFASSLAPLLGQDVEELIQKLQTHRQKGFLWLSRRLAAEQVEQIQSLKLPTESYGFEKEYRRHYPQGRLAAHVIGLRDIDGNGRGGVEQACDAWIRGKDGARVLVRNARNRVVHLYEPPGQQVQEGQTVRLSIDIRLQQILEQQMSEVQQAWAPIGCCAILCDPQTGEILAMASQPGFHPEQPETFQDEAWMNRAIAWSYEPGSTIKPLIVAWGMQQQLIDPATRFFCHWGAYRMGPRLLRDTHPHGELSLAEVLIKSSNIGMAQIGELLTNDGLAEALNRFGFGLRTGIGLAGELPGFVRPVKDWNHYSTGSIPMGQELMATPLQMLVAHATLANGGTYRQPRLVLEPGPGPLVESPLINPGIAHWVVREPMKRVLTEGTGRRANSAELSLFGKTGTSQVYDQEQKLYSNEKSVCSFVCGIPAEQPELLVLVVVDQPTIGTSHFGSNVAAPAAVKILEQAYPLKTRRLARSLVEPIR